MSAYRSPEGAVALYFRVHGSFLLLLLLHLPSGYLMYVTLLACLPGTAERGVSLLFLLPFFYHILRFRFYGYRGGKGVSLTFWQRGVACCFCFGASKGRTYDW